MAILYPEPIQAFRFLVRVGDSEEISAAFSRFSGIQMQVETIQARDGSDARGVKEYTPVFTSFAPVTLRQNWGYRPGSATWPIPQRPQHLWNFCLKKSGKWC